MKILIVSTSDCTGGAAIAAKRLLDSLNQIEDTEARMLVAKGSSNRKDICILQRDKTTALRQKAAFIAERGQIFLQNKRDRSKLFHVCTASFGIPVHNHPWIKWADVIHFHWINQGFLSLKEIEKIGSLGKPVIWTLHDLWPATSICHHPRTCNGYTKDPACGRCPQINSKKEKDLSRKIAIQKKKVWDKLNLSIVGCSKWITDQARKSSLLQKASFNNIPNPIDTELYTPTSREAARRELSIPTEGFFILFGAVQADDYRKGINELAEMLSIIYSEEPEMRKELHLIVFGNMNEEARAKLPNFKTHFLGYVRDKKTMAKAYNAADLFVTTSLEENLPNTIMEALSCGTPCTGFEVGGIPEMIQNQQMGYVAPFKDVRKMKDFILNFYDEEKKQKESNKIDDDLISKVRNCCRCTVLGTYNSKIVAQQYHEVYKKSLKY